MVLHNRMLSCPLPEFLISITTHKWKLTFPDVLPYLSIMPRSSVRPEEWWCVESWFTFAVEEVHEESFGQKKRRQMFSSSRVDSIFGEDKKN